MKKLLSALCACALTGTCIADDAADAGAKLREYFAAFNAREIDRIASEIYSTPVHIGVEQDATLVAGEKFGLHADVSTGGPCRLHNAGELFFLLLWQEAVDG